MVGEGPGFLLESVEGGERWGRYSFVGRAPCPLCWPGARSSAPTGPLEVPDGAAERGAGHARVAARPLPLPVLADLPPLHGGVVGYLGYDVVREVEQLPDVPPDDQGFPDAALVVIGQLCAFDHWRQRMVLVDNVVIEHWTPEECEAAYVAAGARLGELAAECFGRRAGGAGAAARPRRREGRGVPHHDSEQYQRAVAVAKEHIAAGDIFQVVLSQRFDLTLGVDPFEVYRALRLLNPSPYLYFLRFDEVTVVGSSPEPMVRLRDGVVTSRPIAGSRPRGATPRTTAAGGRAAEDPKEVAEHVMLVDLARNDVGRVVRFGTETVEELMTVERYSHIMHLTSQVAGQLSPGHGPIDVLRATLPAGTLSGAPKVRAMEIIDDLEPTKRGIYGGVVGYLDFSGNLDTAIAIRTMVVAPDGGAWVQAGAGIVADSDPATEDAECAHKAAALLAAVAAARTMAAGPARGCAVSDAAVPAGWAIPRVAQRPGAFQRRARRALGARARRPRLPPGAVQPGRGGARTGELPTPSCSPPTASWSPCSG